MIRPSIIFAFVAIVFAARCAFAQFNPGPNPISGIVTAPQTIATGTGAVNSGATLSVTGNNVAITVTGSSTINNDGTIQQTSVLTGGNAGNSRGIRDSTAANINLIFNNGSATNSAALLQTAGADCIQLRTGSTSVIMNNYGTINSQNSAGGGNQAVDWNGITTGANTLNNFSTGLVKASEADAVRPGVNGVVNNSGTILSMTTTGSSSDGVDAQNNSGVQVTNETTGLIEGGRHGITGGALNNAVIFTTSVTNNGNGIIKGDNGSGINLDGFNANQTATIINHGIITGNGVTGDGDGIDVDGLVNVTNTGTIKSLNAVSATVGVPAQSEGITVGGGTIVNSGLIEGDVAAGNTNAVGRGISLLGNDIATGPLAGTREAIYGNAVVTNQTGGVIRGQSDSGIAVDGPASGFTVTINNNAGGLIEGGGTTAAIRTGADNDTINNAGTIKADTSGLAIDMGAGNNTLNITGGSASIIGDVSGGTGTGLLTIDPGSGKSFSYNGSFSNFSSAEVRSGTVTLSGASTYSGDTTISAGTLLATNSTGSATGSGNLIVQSSGTLGGTGRIGGNVTLQSGGIISPGLSPGNLSLDASLTIMNGSKFLFELGPTSATSDHVTVAGSFNFSGNGKAIVSIINDGLVVGSDYSLIFFSSNAGLSAANFAFGDVPIGFAGTFSVNSNSLTLHVSAVPESGNTIVLLMISVVLLVRSRAARPIAPDSSLS